ncbi:MAG: histidinol-phosphatase [Chloroflexi bacterium]|nr:histidinol-phosphatase [Chloroflexota bacterium]MDA1239907.1 histidinol-phosphatase [Chloroflexota bacterium]MQC19029.1 histidinol-phosphatase [Chloroflexota bacterium]
MPDTTADILAFALDLADEADRISMSYFRGELGIETKGDGSLVTRGDRAVEAMLRERITARFPGHSILGEEQGYSAGTDAETGRWILDPIDGTHGFARGVPVWAALIAFERLGVIEVGVASAPALATRWWAGRGLGAYRGGLPAKGHAGERIHVSTTATVAESQVLFGGIRHIRARWGHAADAVIEAAWRDRGYGDFWAHCMVADGTAEVMLEPVATPWDLGALSVIVEEAGGRMTDGDGTPGFEHGYAITSNGLVHDEVLRMLRAGLASR